MNYIDEKMLTDFNYNAFGNISLDSILSYAAKNDIIDLYLPLEDYIDAIRRNPNFIPESGRDENGRPFFSIGGIKITGLLKEEADKYRLLK